MNQYQDIHPPAWPLKLLRFFLKERYLEEIEGDMEEMFLTNAEQHSLKKARWIYTWEALKLLRPVLLKNFKPSHTFNQYPMYKNYFIIAWRNLVKKKAYSFINIFGLGLGIACCLLIFMFVQDELSYDNYHAKRDRIYRLTHGWSSGEKIDGKIIHSGYGAMRPLDQHLRPTFQRWRRSFSFRVGLISCLPTEQKCTRKTESSLWILQPLTYSVGRCLRAIPRQH